MYDIWYTCNMYEIEQSTEFEKWFKKQSLKTQSIIHARMLRLELHGHLGDSRVLDSNLFEFKWRNGLRIYYSFRGQKIVLLLNGGGKNAQKKDIQKAKNLKGKYISD